MFDYSKHPCDRPGSIPPNQPPQDSGAAQAPNGQNSLCVLNPKKLDVIYENIPPQLRERSIFCAWRKENVPGRDKPNKVPYNPETGWRLKVNRAFGFLSFTDVLNSKAQGYDGIGIRVSESICAIDIDNCRSDAGTWSDMAVDICTMLQSYTEISPSGRGMRILCLASGFHFDASRYYINHPKLGLEIYMDAVTNKFVTLTGCALFPGRDLEERGPQLEAVLEKYMVRPVPVSPPASVPSQHELDELPDEEVIEIASRGKHGDIFMALLDGDLSCYDDDHSACDMALCGQLAFYTRKNKAQMDRIFRSSGLMRPKWNERRGNKTYGDMTIQTAIDRQTSVYGDIFTGSRPIKLPGYTFI